MGVIMYNGIQYTGAGGGGSDVTPNPEGSATDILKKLEIEDTIYGISNTIELTQAEYDDLPSSKLTDNILYIIKDAAGASGGNNKTLSGTVAPTAALGDNGDEYIQYHLSSNTPVIDAKYTKVRGQWITYQDDSTIVVPVAPTYSAGDHINISQSNEISATYSAFQGTDGTDPGSSGLVPAPTTADANKYLSSAGTWETVQGGGGSSGGAAYTEAVLWNNPTSTSSWSNPVTMTLNDDITNYHELRVIFSNQSGDTYGYVSIPISEVLTHNYTQYFSNDAIGGMSNYVIVDAINEIKGYPKETGTTTYYVKVIGIKYGGNLSPIIYSTEEREVGVWTNGKPLYQKTVIIPTVPSNTSETFPHNISDLETLVDFKVIIENSLDANQNRPDNNNAEWYAHMVPTGLFLRSFRTISDPGSAHYTIWYTKSTDTPGSGKYNTLGVPAVHYSTDEQVIGTWIDGRPMYMKCFQLSNYQLVRSSWTIIDDVEVPNIDDVAEITVSGYDTANNQYPALGGLLSMRFNGDKLQYFLNIDFPIYVKTIILRYTKTTD